MFLVVPLKFGCSFIDDIVNVYCDYCPFEQHFKPFFLAKQRLDSLQLRHFRLFLHCTHWTLCSFLSVLLRFGPHTASAKIFVSCSLSICFIPICFWPLLIANVRWFLLLHFLRLLLLPTNPFYSLAPSGSLLLPYSDLCALLSACLRGAFMHRRIRHIPKIGKKVGVGGGVNKQGEVHRDCQKQDNKSMRSCSKFFLQIWTI